MESPDASIGRATILIVISALSFGSISVLTVLTTTAGVPLLTTMAWRYVLGALLLGSLARSRTIRSIPKRQAIPLLLIGGFGHALVSALLYSVYLPALEHVQEGVPAMFATFLLIAGAAVSFVLTALFARELFLPQGSAVWTNILLLALVSTVIAFSSLIKGLSVLGPVRTAIIATVEPFFTALLGVLVLRNQLSAATLVGGIVIAAAILVIELSSTRMPATA